MTYVSSMCAMCGACPDEWKGGSKQNIKFSTHNQITYEKNKTTLTFCNRHRIDQL
jgi:hypothetical protein